MHGLSLEIPQNGEYDAKAFFIFFVEIN